MHYVLYLILLLVILVVCVVSAWLRARQQRAGVVVQTLASIVSQNLPLAQAVRAAAAGERRALRRTYGRVAAELEAGATLSTALRSAMYGCPGEVVGALQGAERGGTLPSVLQALAARFRRRVGQAPTAGVPMWYPLILLVVLPLVLTFFLVIVVPKFREIFDDFGTSLPPMTVRLINWARPVEELAPLIVFALVLLLLLAVVQFWVGRHLFTRVPDRAQPLFALWDTLAWCLPVLRQGARSYALGQQLVVVQAALRAGHDLAAAARQGVCVAVNWHARQRLQQWAAALEAGTDPAGGARRLGFPTPLVQAIATARADGELALRFEYLADYYQALYQHWLRVLAAVFTPLMVVGWALVVGYVVVAVMLPLVALVQSVISIVD